jgi:hypothetical protein
MPIDMMNVSDKAMPTIKAKRALISELLYGFFMGWLLLCWCHILGLLVVVRSCFVCGRYSW